MKLHHFATKAWGNTADAARYVAEQGNQTLAAIASAETAKLYGLQILAEGVNEDGDNTTRFIVIEKEGAQRQPIAAAPGQRLSMLFTVDHKPGRLARVIQIIGERGFNMETIKSRPLPHVQFEYYFYVQLVCPANAATDDCAKLVHELENVCRTVAAEARSPPVWYAFAKIELNITLYCAGIVPLVERFFWCGL